jgi:hypothetical protein
MLNALTILYLNLLLDILQAGTNYSSLLEQAISQLSSRFSITSAFKSPTILTGATTHRMTITYNQQIETPSKQP